MAASKQRLKMLKGKFSASADDSMIELQNMANDTTAATRLEAKRNNFVRQKTLPNMVPHHAHQHPHAMYAHGWVGFRHMARMKTINTMAEKNAKRETPVVAANTKPVTKVAIDDTAQRVMQVNVAKKRFLGLLGVYKGKSTEHLSRIHTDKTKEGPYFNDELPHSSNQRPTEKQ